MPVFAGGPSTTPPLLLAARAVVPLWLPVRSFPGCCFRCDWMAVAHDIEAVDFEIGLCSAQYGNFVCRGYGALFAREHGKVIVFPKNWHDLPAALATSQSKMNHESNAATRVLYPHQHSGLA